MSRKEIVAGVRDVLEKYLQVTGVSEDTHLFQDLELDSVQQLTFVVELENYFGIGFDEGEELDIETIGDVVDLVAQKL